MKGQIDITSGTQKETVLVSVFNPESPARTEVQGLYVEENGYISIPAADFHRKFESNDIRMSILPGLGFEGRSLQLGNPTAPLQMYRAGDVPGWNMISIHLMPGFMMYIRMFCRHFPCMLSGTTNCRNILTRIQSIVSV